MRALGRHSFAVHNAMMILLVISLMLVGINSCPYLEELEATQGPRSPAAEWLYQIASDPQVQQVGYNPVLYKVLDKGQGPAHCQATDLVQVCLAALDCTATRYPTHGPHGPCACGVRSARPLRTACVPAGAQGTHANQLILGCVRGHVPGWGRASHGTR